MPITIIGEERREDNDNEDDNDNDSEDIPAPTTAPLLASTATPVVTSTSAQVITDATTITGTASLTTGSTPRYLPETGQWALNLWPVLAWGVGLLAAVGLYLLKKINN